MANQAIRQEINIICATLSGTGTSTSNATVQLDTNQYSGSPTYYFEACFNGAASNTGTVKLRDLDAPSNVASLAGATSATYIVSRVAFTPTAGARSYTLQIVGDGTRTQTVHSARIIILQNETKITQTVTQIEIGNQTAALSNTAVADITNPKFWTYTAANWSGTVTFFAEVIFTTSAKNTTTITLCRTSDNATNATIVSAGTNSTGYASSGQVAFTPVDGETYKIRCLGSTTKSTYSIACAKIYVAQAGTVTTSIVAKGGTGGGPAQVSQIGGQASGGTGTTKFSGGDSGAGVVPLGGGGGGGSSAGTAANGNNGANAVGGTGGAGGAAPTGGSAGADGGNTGFNGQSAANFGGGGGGAGTNNPVVTGGNGVRGKAVLTYGTQSSTFSSASASTFTFSVPPGITSIDCEAWAGGGGGSAGNANTAAGGGGSGGAYSKTPAITVSTGDTISITVGLGGAAGTVTNTQAGNGGDTTITVVHQTPITKLEPQFLLLNTADSNATGVQNYLTTWTASEWGDVGNTGSITYKHAMDSDNASNSIKLYNATDADDVTSTVTGTGQQVSSALTVGAGELVTAKNYDTWVLNTTGVIAAARILVLYVYAFILPELITEPLNPPRLR